MYGLDDLVLLGQPVREGEMGNGPVATMEQQYRRTGPFANHRKVNTVQLEYGFIARNYLQEASCGNFGVLFRDEQREPVKLLRRRGRAALGG